MRRRFILISLALSLAFLSFVPKSLTDSPRSEPEFVYARIRYHMTFDGARMREQAWHHDYPFSDEMFPSVLAEVTNVKSNDTAYKIVDIDSPDIFKYPFAYLCEPGFIDLQPKDVVNLREWLNRGGFLLVDDFRTASYGPYGPEDDITHFRAEMKKMYPDREFVHLDINDPIFNTFYKIESLNMAAPYVWQNQPPAEFLGLRNDKGNLVMILNNNNDISEYWEWLDRGEKDMH